MRHTHGIGNVSIYVVSISEARQILGGFCTHAQGTASAGSRWMLSTIVSRREGGVGRIKISCNSSNRSRMGFESEQNMKVAQPEGENGKRWPKVFV